MTLGTVPAGLYESGAYGPGTPRLHRRATALRLFDRQRLAFIRAVSPAGGAAARRRRRPRAVRRRGAIGWVQR